MPLGSHLNASLIGIALQPVVHWLFDAIGNPNRFSFTGPHCREMQLSESFGEKFKNLIYCYKFKSQLRYHLDQQDVYVRKHFPGMPHISKIRKDFDLILSDSHYSLHGTRPLANAIVEVGGLHIQEDDSPLEPVHNILYFFGSSIDILVIP